MRTTLDIEADVLQAAKEIAAREERAGLAGCVQLLFQHRNEDMLPSLFLPGNRLLRVESLLEAQPGLRFAQAQDSPAVGQLEQKQVQQCDRCQSET